MATMEKLKERPEAYLTLLDAMEKYVRTYAVQAFLIG